MLVQLFIKILLLINRFAFIKNLVTLHEVRARHIAGIVAFPAAKIRFQILVVLKKLLDLFH